MKVLIASNAPWTPTGYGQQTQQLAARLRDAGHKVGVSAFYGLAGSRLEWDGIRVYPGFLDGYGNDVLLHHAREHFGGDPRGGIVITLVDAWVLNPAVIGQLNALCWAPVDHEPCPPRVAHALKESGCTPVAMSRFGERMMRNEGLEPVYAPHGIDTTVFSPQDHDTSRVMLGIAPDRFVVGMVAANKGQPPRKGFPEGIAAFSELLKDDKDALLFLHTEAEGAVDGVNLTRLLHAHGVPQENVMFTDQYQHCVVGRSQRWMAQMYSALDVLLQPSYGEGFGIPIIEAQACGTPVIATDCTAMTELAQVGWSISGRKTWTIQNAFWTMPDVGELVWALKEARKGASRLRAAAREHAVQYDADRVFAECWEPILADRDPAAEALPRVEVAA